MQSRQVGRVWLSLSLLLEGLLRMKLAFVYMSLVNVVNVTAFFPSTCSFTSFQSFGGGGGGGGGSKLSQMFFHLAHCRN